ncbi:MAG: hypothetical protein U0234_02255 [Sandaracinus sp.]
MLAQDVDAGVLEPTDAGEIIPDSGLALDVDAGTAPADEQPELDIPLPEGHEATVTLGLRPDSGAMTGDIVTAIVTVTLPEGDDVGVPHQEFGDLELHDQRHTDSLDGDRRTYVFELDFLMLEPGDHELPPIRLRIVTADGAVGTAHTESRMIHVGSLIANEPDAQARPASQPVPVMQDDYTLAYVFGALGLLALGALIAWLVIRWWQRQPKALPPPPPPRPAWELALEKIEGLKKRLPTALAEGKQVEVVDGVSDALREYLGARFDFNGLESTTDEVIARVRHQRLGPIALEEIVALLGDADLVKFAKAVPDEETCSRMIEGSVRIVRGTMAVPTPAIATPARPAGVEGEGERTSRAPKKKAKTGVDERMLAKAAESHAAAEAAVAAPPPVVLPPSAVVPPSGATPAAGVREDGRREVPDTNPPAAPKTLIQGGADVSPTIDGPSPQPSPTAAGEGASDTASPWRESPPTIADGTRDPNDKDGDR